MNKWLGPLEKRQRQKINNDFNNLKPVIKKLKIAC